MPIIPYPSDASATVLVVEDDAALVAMLHYNLVKRGFRVIEATDGQAARDCCAEAMPQIVLLDWMLPTLSGIEVCRWIRAQPEGHKVAVIMVTAQTDERDIVWALEAGADDYVAKPFSMANLVARMHALLRRNGGRPTPDRLVCGDIVMDLVTWRAHRGGQLLRLGPTEFRLLRFLMAHPGQVFTRDAVLDAVWGRAPRLDPRTLDVHIGRLRRAIRDDGARGLIRTVRGAGYALDDNAA